ncbi:hypothetical protein TVAG_014220 [Trichomonas vaginalis G3]|uniref:SDE2-like domain-containing protein n=1 Tax=Trichomonas vaginalis (strain ATCC PRA-98 / G3) TaxID=412133 RepID=A2DDH6_TRIV3|nr:Silencing defective 2 N-terminal ubiquitin domain family [Trichomonas vaginalis G3]EAY21655.1 hypothetical protein TVAG_014220 [Trichomonas vaginalis G3]KAI5489670.1 Silencing defective 2 N-terminal ubiquitin domain family [Trichomonas vaginalis G3]|eukprot:XP_001582641.1 hypothetical protein [Trichomonas vaginalis G3]
MTFRLFNKYFSYDSTRDIGQILLERFSISPNSYYTINNHGIIEIRFRCNGGKGNFGRAIKREGERRSRRLPRFKDSCRTLGGKRIGTLKAKKRIEELKQKIEERENIKNANKELRLKTNKEKEIQLLTERENDTKEMVVKSMEFAFENKLPERQSVKEENVFTNINIDDILDESDSDDENED